MAKGHQGRLGRDLSLMSPEATSAREAGLKQRTSVRTRVVMKRTGNARRGLTRRFIFFPQSFRSPRGRRRKNNTLIRSISSAGRAFGKGEGSRIPRFWQAFHRGLGGPFQTLPFGFPKGGRRKWNPVVS